jgi:glycosyltransferase involved in cell wall biosynthesis
MVVAIWVYLLIGRGGFWLGRERDDATGTGEGPWPAIAAVIPARDEAESVGRTITSLLQQDYPGEFSILLVDDQSRDGTTEIARSAAASLGDAERLTVVSGRQLPAGWTGKLWAQQQGVEAALAVSPPPDYLLLTDADIVYMPHALKALTLRARRGGYVLTSLMVKLRCTTLAEHFFIPAFIFFFQMLYPFAWANDPRRATAAARRRLHARAPRRACASRRDGRDPRRAYRRLRAGKKVEGARSDLDRTDAERVQHPRLSGARRHSSHGLAHRLRATSLLATAAGGHRNRLGANLYCAGRFGLVRGGRRPVPRIAAWLLMALALQPTLRFYRVSPLWGVALPAIAAIYMAFTVDSAYQHWRGRGGMWKGRAQGDLRGKVSELR